MRCPVCNETLAEEARFCPKCGAEVKAQGEGSRHRTARRRSMIAAAAFALAAAFLACTLTACGPKAIPDDALRSMVANSSFAQQGLTAGGYVDESAYELTDFAVDSQETVDIPDGALPEGSVLWNVAFSGTLENANFRTEFAGTAQVLDRDGSYETVEQPMVTGFTTTPLKGVDSMDTAGSGAMDDAWSASGFASTLEGGDGAWISVASEQVAYDFWFATDTATNTQRFTFDQEDGWTPQGNAEMSGMATEWKLDGTSFSLKQGATLMDLMVKDGTIAFTAAENGSLTADYTYNANPSASSVNAVALSFEGTLTGEPIHEFGNGRFSVELNDPEGGVTLACESTTSSVKAGSGTVNALSADIITDSPYDKNGLYAYNSYGLTFTENV